MRAALFPSVHALNSIQIEQSSAASYFLMPEIRSFLLRLISFTRILESHPITKKVSKNPFSRRKTTGI